MSSLRVDNIQSKDGGAPNINNGFIVPANRTAQFGDFIKSGATMTAGSFVGNGSGLTNVTGSQPTEVYALMIIT